jgi:folate-binding protein YgfZ
LPEPARLSPELLELLRIEAGIPRWGRELTAETLPPEAGLDRTHIDYHKGCYIGQEVISRVKSVGHVNRHLRGFTSPEGKPLPPGGRLFSAAEPARPCGQLTSTAWSFALAMPIGLGYLKRGSPEALVVRPAHGDEPALEVTICELPFTAS